MAKRFLSIFIALALSCAALPVAPVFAWGDESSLPAEYYLTNLGYVTPAKLQSPWGTCWAFAVAAAIESSILKAQIQLESEPLEDGLLEESEAVEETGLDAETEGALHPMAAIRGGQVSAMESPSGSTDESGGSVAGATVSDVAVNEAVDMTEPDFSKLDPSVDVSERAIGWFAHEPQSVETAGSQAGEGYIRNDASPFTQFEGGNFSIAAASLVARQSLLSESSAPYVYNGYDGSGVAWYRISSNGSGTDARTRDWSLPADLRISEDTGWYVSDVLCLPSPAILSTDPTTGLSVYEGYDSQATDSIKEALMDVGAVAVCLNSELSLPSELSRDAVDSTTLGDSINYSTWSQYSAADSFTLNHAVTVVGWDDSYPVEAFQNKSGALPPAAGAWLCKNNWGSSEISAANGDPDSMVKWGIRADGTSATATGFFWLSYYDHTLSTPVAFGVEPVIEESLYQYDYLGASEYFKPTTYTSEVLVGNVFHAEGTELIESVGGWTFDEDETIHTYIYALPSYAGSFESGGSQGSSEADGEDGQDVESPDASEGDAAGSSNSQQAEDQAAPTIKNGEEFKEALASAYLLAEDVSDFPTAGFHTIDLPEPVLVYEGEAFVVIQQVDTIATTFSGESKPATYLNLEVAFTDTFDYEGSLSRPNVVSNDGETFVSVYGPEDWRSVAEYNDWYADLKTQGNQSVDMVFGNALVKAMGSPTSMGLDSRVYEHVQLEPVTRTGE